MSEETWDKDIRGLDDVDGFLGDPNKLILYAYLEELNDRKKIKFVDQIEHARDNKIVVFSKNKPSVLTDDNIFGSLQITSVSGPPTLALYHTLNNVFTPLLMQVCRFCYLSYASNL